MTTVAAPEQEAVEKAGAAKAAARRMATISTSVKDEALEAMARALVEREGEILQRNSVDVQVARSAGAPEAMVDRLALNPRRIGEMAEGLRQVAALADPVGEVIEGWRRPNGLEIRKVRVPLGVIGMIYESRPNVTVDAAGLCLKAGNAVVLRGGSEAINSNIVLAETIAQAAVRAGIPEGAISLIESTDRAAVRRLMTLNKLVDVLIPRGGAGLIQAVVEGSSVPVIETGVGNCHLYVDADADLEMAARICINAKCQRPGVCNAIETLLVHRQVAEEFLPKIGRKLSEQSVELRADERAMPLLEGAAPAAEQDWDTEFLSLILAVKVVDSLEEAVEHIERHGTRHSEAIITRDYTAAHAFVERVDAAAVYVNASTRFTDGFQYGLGAEIGISTQKLHARGPMGLRELTSYKFVVLGEGQIRS